MSTMRLAMAGLLMTAIVSTAPAAFAYERFTHPKMDRVPLRGGQRRQRQKYTAKGTNHKAQRREGSDISLVGKQLLQVGKRTYAIAAIDNMRPVVKSHGRRIRPTALAIFGVRNKYRVGRWLSLGRVKVRNAEGKVLPVAVEVRNRELRRLDRRDYELLATGDDHSYILPSHRLIKDKWSGRPY